jgi:hypothetical protein
MKLTRSTKNAVSERMCFLSEVDGLRGTASSGQAHRLRPALFGRLKGFKYPKIANWIS